MSINVSADLGIIVWGTSNNVSLGNVSSDPGVPVYLDGSTSSNGNMIGTSFNTTDGNISIGTNTGTVGYVDDSGNIGFATCVSMDGNISIGTNTGLAGYIDDSGQILATSGSFTVLNSAATTVPSTSGASFGNDGSIIVSNSGTQLLNLDNSGNLFVTGVVDSTGNILCSGNLIADSSGNLYSPNVTSGKFLISNGTSPVTGVTLAFHTPGTPTLTRGQGAGGPTGTTLSITGSDVSGYITVTVGLSPAASTTIVTVNFNTAYSSAPNNVVITPGNSAAALLNGATSVFYPAGTAATTNFTIISGTTALVPTTTYIFNYNVTQQ